MLTGVSRAAQEAGVILITSHLGTSYDLQPTRQEAIDAVDTLIGFRVDGIVFATRYFTANELREFDRHVPVIAMNSMRGVPSTDVGSQQAAREATQHLLDLGHRKILHVAGPKGTGEAAERERAFRAAMTSAGLEPLPVVRSDSWEAHSGARAAELVDPSSFTAVFAANDEIALGFQHTLRARGLNAPQDYSIVGLDDSADSAFANPPLTTVRLDFRKIGERSMELLLNRIETGVLPGNDEHLGFEFIHRASTRPLVRADAARARG